MCLQSSHGFSPALTVLQQPKESAKIAITCNVPPGWKHLNGTRGAASS